MAEHSENTSPVYFWKPEGETGYLGQWWPSSFIWTHGNERYTYANAEQYYILRSRTSPFELEGTNRD